MARNEMSLNIIFVLSKIVKITVEIKSDSLTF